MMRSLYCSILGKIIFIAALLGSSFSFANDEKSYLDADIVADALTHGKELYDQYIEGKSLGFTLAEIAAHALIEIDQRTAQQSPQLLLFAFHAWGVYDQVGTTRERFAGIRAGMSASALVFISASAYATYSHSQELLESWVSLKREFDRR